MTILLLYIDSMVLTISQPQFLPLLLMMTVVAIFFAVLASNRIILRRVRQRMKNTQMTTAMMQKALEISANNVVRYDVRDRYTYKLYGYMIPDEGINVDDWKAHVHRDDLEEALDWLHQVIDGKLPRAEFRYRWNFDFTGGEPRWGYMYNISVPEFIPGTKRVASVISTLRDETQLRQREQEEDELSSKYKLIFEMSIVGLSFYTADGWLIDANKMMRDICHFDSDDYDCHFSRTNLFDASPFLECCDKNNLEELWICHQSIVPERDIHDYLETRLHPIRDDDGKVAYIAITTRNVTEERQMYLQAKLNDIQIQQANEKIMAYEEELTFMMEACEMRAWRSSFEDGTIQFYKGLSSVERQMTFKELADYFLDDSEIIHQHFANPSQFYTQSMSYMGRTRAIFHDSDEVQWNQINSIPLYDKDGRLIGGFGLIRNISSLMHKQELLKQETERANDSGRLKSVFLANMTHEIRTPLNAIVGFSDLLQAIESPDDRREMIRVIHNNCDMLLRLINDILVLSNVDANSMQIVPADVDFAQEFAAGCLSLAQRIESPAVEFQSDQPYRVLHTRLDMGRLQQVITNFVTNAVKYTQQGHIRIGYRLQTRNDVQGIYVYCEDTGSGIPKDQCERIFERFVKLNDYIQGTGLGLSICKAIVERCDGQIGVDSEEGHGSTFWFWIPAEIGEKEENQNLP